MKTLSAKYQLAVIISLLIGLNSFGQQTKNYINNWYFGDAVGISFNSGTATNTTSAIQSYEVSTSYSDGNGNVLFYGGASNNTAYGDGRVIWDASHDTMPNSNIHVDYTSSCGLTAVPVPGNCDQYYIFHLVGSTPASVGMGNSLHYSVVDMTLPGNGTIPAPLGDIDPAQKDILVYGPDTLAEKVKIVQQGNTENYWVITRSINRDVFYSFEVTSAGVNTIPVISTISATTWPTAIGSPAFSWLAVNKDRNKIAEANGYGPEVKLYDFDNLTGLLTLAEDVIPTGTFGSDIPYGIEFSPSGNVLYVNWYEGGTNTYISSFDITVGSPGIAATRQDYLIATGAAQYGALVKAPDGKIYGTRETTTQLIVINSPENYLAPNITTPGFNPSPGSSDVGMPNLTYYYHPDNFIDTLAGNDRIGTCSPFQTEIGAIGYDSIWANYVWSPAAMLAGSTSEATPLTVSLTADQEYILHVIHACGDTIKSDTTWVRVNNCSISCPGNLVPNPSFETNSGFPSALGDFALTTNWNNCNGAATPDYLSTSGTNAAMLPVGVGGLGRFNPNSGNGIMALIIKGALFGVYREYIDAPLTTPLIVGTTYDVSFYMANAGDLGKNGLRSNNIGVNFSVGALTQVGFAALNIVPTWNYNTVFYDTTWTLVNFQFTATAAVDHITIGNFYNDIATTTVNHIPSALQTSYVGFDDFCVTPVVDSLIISNDTSICQGDSVLLIASGSSTGYNWIDSTTLAPLGTDSFYMASPIITTTYGIYNASDTVYTTVTVFNSSSVTNVLSECDGYSITVGSNTYNTTGIYNDTLVGANSNGCDSIIETDLTINPSDTATFTYAPTSYCLTDPNPLPAGIVTTGGAFTIDNSGSINAATGAVNLVLSGIGTYLITYTTTGLCPDTATFSISIASCALPTAAYTISDSNICVGECITFTDQSIGATGWQWAFAGGTPATANTAGPHTVCYAADGIFNVELIVSNTSGADTTTSTVVVNATPTISAGANVTLELGQSTTLNATGTNGAYTWAPPTWLDCPTCVSPISTPEETITYTVIIVDSNGCTASDDVTVFVNYDNVIWVANIFSPNGDGNNDVLFVRGKGVESFQFVVYDRWGEKVFETQDLDKGWNGSFRGKEMNKSVFVYYLKGFFIDGTEFNQKGDITLLR